jgi:hypothetical protein
MDFDEIISLNPQDFWKHEALDFTPWLFENLHLLGKYLGIDIEPKQREHAVGKFSLDILGTDVVTNRPIIIENQLCHTDHDHLGKLLTYAAGTDAAIVIWIATEIREEHWQTLEWLNSKTVEGLDFFAVVLKVERIGNSKPAVRFEPVVRPNEWQKQTLKAARSSTSEKGEKYREFYQVLIDELRDNYQFTNAKLGQAQCWYAFASGKTGFNYSCNFTGVDTVRAEVYIDCQDRDTNKQYFDSLYNDREAIESAFGEELEWQRLDERRACRICIHRNGTIEDGEEKLKEIRAWVIPRLLKLKEVFGPRIQSM